MSLAIVDYGMGNHASLVNALKRCGVTPHFVSTPEEIMRAERLILPGVGAFGAAIQKLMEMGLIDVLRDFADSGKPMLGVCLGMQIMFERGEEGGDYQGLGLFPGVVVRMDADQLKVPHVGFNDLSIKKNDGIFKSMIAQPDFYFTHGYCVKDTSPSVIAAICSYGLDFVAAVEKGNIAATQFHPELSQKNGLTMIANFLEKKNG